MLSRFQAVTAIALTLIFIHCPAHAAEQPVPQWQPHDFVFSDTTPHANPFRVRFSAVVAGPDGIKLILPGFYDGNGSWKIRVSPTVKGQWSVTTSSSSAGLDNQRRSFECVPKGLSNSHGALCVDKEYPHQFIFEDGTRFFPMGYECDWLWALDTNDPKLPTIITFLDTLQKYGFNFVILNAYAHDTTWRKGRSSNDDFGPSPLFAWEGSNDEPDHARFNLAYWGHYDRLLQAMYERGIVAHILIKVYNKQVNWPVNRSAEDDLYFRWLIARYAAYSNVTWDFAKEAQYEKDLDYKTERLRFIRTNDPYRRLLTIHDDRGAYDNGSYNGLVDYRSDQQHSKWRESMRAHLNQNAWPVINTEFGYEHGPKGLADKTYKVVQSPEEVCRRAWEVYASGGFGAYYYTHTAWDVVRPHDTPPGYAYFKHLRDFFEKTEYWRMRPVEDVASVGYCLANPGKEYVVFLDAAAPFQLKLEGDTALFNVQWYQPFNGMVHDGGLIKSGTVELIPPAEWGKGPLALHLRARSSL